MGLDGVQDLVGPTNKAGRGGAKLKEVFPNRFPIKEGRIVLDPG